MCQPVAPPDPTTLVQEAARVVVVRALEDFAELEGKVEKAAPFVTFQRIKVLNTKVEHAVDLRILSQRLRETAEGVGQRLLGDSASDPVSMPNLR